MWVLIENRPPPCLDGQGRTLQGSKEGPPEVINYPANPKNFVDTTRLVWGVFTIFNFPLV
ncbi:MAG TPA: hypothetical protein DD706_21755 [Nitrospiraceae bacterium]|nr:hypothetical protein [Nitrospiraceae bacterium]